MEARILVGCTAGGQELYYAPETAATLISKGGFVMKSTLVILFAIFSSLLYASDDVRLGKSSREDRNGWISIHLEGKPGDVGYQHGYLLAPEIDDALKMFKQFLEGSTKKNWDFYREAAARMFWPRLEREYQEEIEGIAEGLRAKGLKYDKIDISNMQPSMIGTDQPESPI